MRSVNIIFEDSEFDELIKIKGREKWREFILRKCLGKKHG